MTSLARKEKERKANQMARKKRQADPFADESTEVDDDPVDIGKKVFPVSNSYINFIMHNFIKETKGCPHANKSVSMSNVRKNLKTSLPIGECVQCRKEKVFSKPELCDDSVSI